MCSLVFERWVTSPTSFLGQLLKNRHGEVAQRIVVGPDAEHVTFAGLKKGLLDDYEANERKSTRRMKIAVQHLEDAFGLLRACDITATRVDDYVKARRSVPVKNATITAELAALKRMYTLAIQNGLLAPAHRPHIRSLKVDNARAGFFERGEFESVLAHLPAYAQPIVEFLYLTGWRIGEVLPLQWRQVDFKAGTVRLEGSMTKNGEPRVFPFSVLPPLAELLQRQRERVEAIEKATATIIPHVFVRDDGAVIKSFRKAWKKATEAAGHTGRIRHDFRRTAVRNMERAGVPRSVAMKLSGHLTESIYRRYAIVSEADLSAGVAKLATLHEADRRAEPKVVALGSRTGTKRA